MKAGLSATFRGVVRPGQERAPHAARGGAAAPAPAPALPAAPGAARDIEIDSDTELSIPTKKTRGTRCHSAGE
jgi:hypothetical protein